MRALSIYFYYTDYGSIMMQNKFANVTEGQMNNSSLLFLSFNISLVFPWIHWLNLEQNLLILYDVAEIIPEDTP